MNITDPIADMLTRIRNASTSKFKTVDIPASNMKKSIAQILLDEGYIKAFEEIENETQGIITKSFKWFRNSYNLNITRVNDRQRSKSKRYRRRSISLYLVINIKKNGGKYTMSRIGNKPIVVPDGVEVKIDGNAVTVKGPKGTLSKEFHKNINIAMEDKTITLTRCDDEPQNRALHGLTRTLLANMIEGTTNEFTRQLEINGVGYRAQKSGTKLVLTLGYSHPVEMEAPEGITFEVPNPNTIIVRGIDKELVGQTAAVIRTKRPPEVYRGKGIKYADEVIRRKEGKAGKK